MKCSGEDYVSLQTNTQAFHLCLKDLRGVIHTAALNLNLIDVWFGGGQTTDTVQTHISINRLHYAAKIYQLPRHLEGPLNIFSLRNQQTCTSYT